MCTSTTILVYGIIVKAWSLIIAGLAFQRLVPVSLALDIIILRSRNGSLAMSNRGISRSVLPTEIWEMIKRESIDLAIDLVERRQLERITGTSCEPCWDCGRQHGLNTRKSGEPNFNNPGDDYGDIVLDRSFELAYDPTPGELERRSAFLDSFGMECRVSMQSQERFGPFLCSIALKSITRAESILTPGQNRDNPSTGIDVEHNGMSNVSVAFIDPALFTGIDYRVALSKFKRVVKDYHIDIEDSKTTEHPTFTTALSTTAATGSNDEEKLEERKNTVLRKLKLNAVQPKWMVLTSLDDCM